MKKMVAAPIRTVRSGRRAPSCWPTRIASPSAASDDGGPSDCHHRAQPVSIASPAGSTAYQSGIPTPFVSPAAWSPAK
jgi:hypothetical protein